MCLSIRLKWLDSSFIIISSGKNTFRFGYISFLFKYLLNVL